MVRRPVFSHAKWFRLENELWRRVFLAEILADTHGMSADQWKRYTRMKALAKACEVRRRIALEFHRNGWEYDKGWMLDREFVYRKPATWQYEDGDAWNTVASWLYTRLNEFCDEPNRPDPRDEDAWYEWGRRIGRLRKAIQHCDDRTYYHDHPEERY